MNPIEAPICQTVSSTTGSSHPVAAPGRTRRRDLTREAETGLLVSVRTSLMQAFDDSLGAPAHRARAGLG